MNLPRALTFSSLPDNGKGSGAMILIDDLAEDVARLRLAGRSVRVQALRQAIDTCGPSGAALESVLQRLERAGLGYAVRSWRSGREVCVRVSPQRLHAALGWPEVARLAGRAGLTADEFTAELSEQLPGLVAALQGTPSPSH